MICRIYKNAVHLVHLTHPRDQVMAGPVGYAGACTSRDDP